MKSTANPTGQTNAIGSTTPGSTGSSLTSTGMTPRNASVDRPAARQLRSRSGPVQAVPVTSPRTPVVIGSPNTSTVAIGDQHRHHKPEYHCDNRDSGIGTSDASVSL